MHPKEQSTSLQTNGLGPIDKSTPGSARVLHELVSHLRLRDELEQAPLTSAAMAQPNLIDVVELVVT